MTSQKGFITHIIKKRMNISGPLIMVKGNKLTQLYPAESTDVSMYDYRILYLQRFPMIVLRFVRESLSRHSRLLVLRLTGMSISRRWRKPKSEFRLNATIYVTLNGLSDGMIFWEALKIQSSFINYLASEWVNGFVRGRDVELDGYEVEAGLSPDSYRITLSGNDKAGIFSGISRTYFNNWCGRMEGKYLFEGKRG